MRKHPSFFRPKHAAPALLILGLASLAFLSLFSEAFSVLFSFLLLLYASFLACGSLCIGIKNHYYRFHYLVISLVMLHFGYGAGMIRGLFDLMRETLAKRASLS